MRNSSSVQFRQRGMTVVEVTLVMGLLLGLLSILFVGVEAYREGAHRAICLQNLAAVQRAMRSFCNLHEYVPGDTVTDMQDELIGPGKFLEEVVPCPSGGVYSLGGDQVPQVGTLYMSCSVSEHIPSSSAAW